MTRDEIKALIPDITDEALGKVLDINGKDITKAKGKSDEYKTQLDTEVYFIIKTYRKANKIL